MKLIDLLLEVKQYEPKKNNVYETIFTLEEKEANKSLGEYRVNIVDTSDYVDYTEIFSDTFLNMEVEEVTAVDINHFKIVLAAE
jgi:hypothetical protein